MSTVNYKKKIIYSLNLHIALQKRGFLAEMEMKNPNNPKYNCWVYKITPEFQSVLDELLAAKEVCQQ